MKQAAFIGAGNMGAALAQGACRALGPEQILVCDHIPAKAAALAEKLGCTAAEDNPAAVREAQYIFLCVKPHLLADVLKDLCPTLEACRKAGEEKVLVSIAAGVQTKTLQEYVSTLSSQIPILRVMPNTCAAIGQGMLALTAPAGTPEPYWTGVEAILAQSGRVERIEEHLMDQFTAVAGCGPAYVYQLIEALADGGVLVGLPRPQAQVYAAQMVLGAAAMVLETGEHPGALKDAVCSPGGSTIAGVAALEAGGFRTAAIQAVEAAYRKNIELGRQ